MRELKYQAWPFPNRVNCWCPTMMSSFICLCTIWALDPSQFPQSLVSMSSYASKMGVEHCSAASLSNMDMHEKMTPQVYKGHVNSKTVKDVTFLGLKCDYVASGQIFIWRKKDGKLTRVMKTDNHLADCIASHPHTMFLASSGFDRDIKIWTPTAFENTYCAGKLKNSSTWKRFGGKHELNTNGIMSTVDIIIRMGCYVLCTAWAGGD